MMTTSRPSGADARAAQHAAFGVRVGHHARAVGTLDDGDVLVAAALLADIAGVVAEAGRLIAPHDGAAVLANDHAIRLTDEGAAAFVRLAAFAAHVRPCGESADPKRRSAAERRHAPTVGPSGRALPDAADPAPGPAAVALAPVVRSGDRCPAGPPGPPVTLAGLRRRTALRLDRTARLSRVRWRARSRSRAEPYRVVRCAVARCRAVRLLVALCPAVPCLAARCLDVGVLSAALATP